MGRSDIAHHRRQVSAFHFLKCMCVCMCVYIYIYMCIYTHTYACVCVYECTASFSNVHSHFCMQHIHTHFNEPHWAFILLLSWNWTRMRASLNIKQKIECLLMAKLKPLASLCVQLPTLCIYSFLKLSSTA